MSAVFWTITAVTSVLSILWLTHTPQTLETPPEVAGRVSYVVDGDSLYLRGYKPQIRLWGVDAPEKNRRGFQEATQKLDEIANGQSLICKQIDVDRYGRTVARCFLPNGQEINRMMIESRTAREYLKFSKGFYSE